MCVLTLTHLSVYLCIYVCMYMYVSVYVCVCVCLSVVVCYISTESDSNPALSSIHQLFVDCRSESSCNIETPSVLKLL